MRWYNLFEIPKQINHRRQFLKYFNNMGTPIQFMIYNDCQNFYVFLFVVNITIFSITINTLGFSLFKFYYNTYYKMYV